MQQKTSNNDFFNGKNRPCPMFMKAQKYHTFHVKDLKRISLYFNVIIYSLLHSEPKLP